MDLKGHNTKDIGGSLKKNIVASVNELTKVLGKPYFYEEDDYPDDDCKTDYCWQKKIRSGEFKGELSLWNYKNGHYDGREIFPDERILFSVHFTNERIFLELEKQLNEIRIADCEKTLKKLKKTEIPHSTTKRLEMLDPDNESMGVLETDLPFEPLEKEWSEYYHNADSENIGVEEFVEIMKEKYPKHHFVRFFIDGAVSC